MMNKIINPPTYDEVQQKIDKFIVNKDRTNQIYHSIKEDELSLTDLAYYKASEVNRLKYTGSSGKNSVENFPGNENRSHLSNSDFIESHNPEKNIVGQYTKKITATNFKVFSKIQLF